VLEQAATFETNLAQPASAIWPAVAELRRHAARAQQLWAEAQTQPFAPVCLTLYLNNECNLGCAYCYANPSPRPQPRLELSTARAGAEVVARNCQAQTLPFILVFHGGGEPTLHQALADQILDEVERIVANYHLPIFRYVATNGVMPARKAVWLAERFDLIGLSCDGPSWLQDRHRPLWGGGATSASVERTAAIVQEAGKSLHTRVTITPHSLQYQTEIADHICRQLKPKEIRVEPIYQAGRAEANNCIEIDHAEQFVTEFLKARDLARGYGIPWQISGSRPWEIHGPYCHVFRHVLNLVPGGAATACFKTTIAAQTRQQGVMIGQMDSTSGIFTLQQDDIQNLRQALRVFPAKCQSCFNQYHCVRDCPSYCPLEGTTPTSEFGCQVQKKLVNALLQNMAATLCAGGEFVEGVICSKVELD
jgi:sulfatase maturation enzyme AslB (radical SAM superfamily)